MRVSFGLRNFATDSESGTWSGSEISDLPEASDGESFCEDFHCEADLPDFVTFSPKTDSVNSTSPKPSTNETRKVKESWSEIDEQARVQEQQKSPSSQPFETSNNTRVKGRKHTTHHTRKDSSSTTKSERSDSWRSGRQPPRERRVRRGNERRARGQDPPLKGAVVRPYTLPSGPITILRRPKSVSETKIGNESETVKLPAAPDLSHLGFVDDERKESANGGKAKVVTTRFGEGFVVDNPPNDKADNPAGQSIPAVNTNVARNAAYMAMAGLKMSNGRGHGSGQNGNSHGYKNTSEADSYDRTLGGQFANSRPRRRPQKNKERNTSGMYSDRMNSSSRSRANVYIGRRPKLETRHVREDDFLVGE